MIRGYWLHYRELTLETEYFVLAPVVSISRLIAALGSCAGCIHETPPPPSVRSALVTYRVVLIGQLCNNTIYIELLLCVYIYIYFIIPQTFLGNITNITHSNICTLYFLLKKKKKNMRHSLQIYNNKFAQSIKFIQFISRSKVF